MDGNLKFLVALTAHRIDNPREVSMGTAMTFIEHVEDLYRADAEIYAAGVAQGMAEVLDNLKFK